MRDEAVTALKAEPGQAIVTAGSSQLVRLLLALELMDEKHLLPTGVVGLDHVRTR